MASILPFIRKYINSKEKTIDKQIEELVDGVGEGSLIAQSMGTFILDKNGDVFVPPCDGVFRIVVVGKGGTPGSSFTKDNTYGACSALIICKLSTKDKIDISITSRGDDHGSSDFSTGISVVVNNEELAFVPEVYTNANANDCGKEYVRIGNTENIISSAMYPGLENGSVGCIIPGLMANEPIQGPPTANIGGATNAPISYPTGRGFMGYIGSLVKAPSYSWYAFGAHGYGASGCKQGRNSSSSYVACSPGGPAACIITLLKKE